MPLADMRTLVYQNLIDLFLGMASGCRNTSRKKEKGPAGLFNRCTRTLRIKSLPTAVPVTRCCSTALKNGTIRQLHRSNKDKKYREVTNHANLFGDIAGGYCRFGQNG